MPDKLSTFRHNPNKYTLKPHRRPSKIVWKKEPAVTGHRQLRYHNRKLNRMISVPVSASPAIIRDFGVILASDDGFVRFFRTGLDKEFWRLRLPSSIYASLVVDPVAEQVLVAATSGLITALDLRGKIRWQKEVGTPIFATPALQIDLRRLGIGAFGHKAISLDLDTGNTIFKYDLPPPWYENYGGKSAYRSPYSSPEFSINGDLIVCCGHTVVCLKSNGTPRWQVNLSAEIKSSPVICERTDTVAIATVSGDCHLIGLIDGHEKICVTLDAKIISSGALSKGILSLGTTSGTVFGIDIKLGSIKWRQTFGAPKSYTSFTLNPEGDFIATNFDGNAICRNAETGAFMWESSQVLGLPDHETAMDITPVVGTSGHMYGASYDGNLYEFMFDRQGYHKS